MVYVLLVLGLAIMGVAFREAIAGWRMLFNPETLSPAEDHDEQNRWQVLNAKLDLITEAMEEMDSKLTSPASPSLLPPPPPEPFGKVLADQEKASIYREIYAAFDAGKDIAEIARQMNRGKGEIQLILNLRRSKG